MSLSLEIKNTYKNYHLSLEMVTNLQQYLMNCKFEEKELNNQVLTYSRTYLIYIQLIMNYILKHKALGKNSLNFFKKKNLDIETINTLSQAVFELDLYKFSKIVFPDLKQETANKRIKSTLEQFEKFGLVKYDQIGNKRFSVQFCGDLIDLFCKSFNKKFLIITDENFIKHIELISNSSELLAVLFVYSKNKSNGFYAIEKYIKGYKETLIKQYKDKEHVLDFVSSQINIIINNVINLNQEEFYALLKSLGIKTSNRAGFCKRGINAIASIFDSSKALIQSFYNSLLNDVVDNFRQYVDKALNFKIEPKKEKKVYTLAVPDNVATPETDAQLKAMFS